MADRIGAFSPEEAKLIKEVVRKLRASGYLDSITGAKPQSLTSLPVYLKNDFGGTIPAYSCVQTNGVVEEDGVNYLKVTRPIDASAKSGAYFFTGPDDILQDEYGTAQSGPVYLVKSDGTAVTTGERWGPKASQFALGKEGLFQVIGPDDLETDLIKVIEDIGQSNHYLFTMTSAFVSGSATATIIGMDATGPTQSVTIIDTLLIFASLVSGSRGICVSQGGKYYVIQAACG